jgi:hypothetical protein
MLLESGGIRFVLRKLEPARAVVQHLQSLECRDADPAALLNAILEGRVWCESSGARDTRFGVTPALRLQAQARRVSPRSIEVWEEQMASINGLHALGIDRVVDEPWVRSALERLHREELIGTRQYAISTLAEADRKIRKAGGDPLAALPNFQARGAPGVRRIDPRALAISLAVIRSVRDDESQAPIVKKDIYQDITVQIESVNVAEPANPISVPGHTTLARILEQEISAMDITRRNHGRRRATKVFRRNSSARDTARRPLEVAEYDDLDCSVYLVDERNGLPWGRAFVTIGVDQFTALPLGYDLSDRHRAYESAVGAICHSLLPKPDFQNGEMGYGCQGQMLLDRASYNESEPLKKQSFASRLLLSTARPRGPTEKQTVEHFIHIARMDFCRRLPGWRGEKNDRDAIDEGVCTAALTLSEFQAMWREWLRRAYCNKPGTDGCTPRERWLKHFEKHTPAVRYSAAQLALFRLRPETTTFRDSGGLLRKELRYDSDELGRLRERLGATAEIEMYVDRHDLTYVMVLDPYVQHLIRVPTTEDLLYVSGLSDSQHSMVLAFARSKGNKHPSLAQLVQARSELAVMAAQAARSNKLRKRQWSRRAPTAVLGDGGVAAEKRQDSSDNPPMILMTDLEYQMEQLRALAIEEGEAW